MPNQTTTDTDELRDELDALRERVAALERLLEQDDESPSDNLGSVLDHRDAAVLDAVSGRGSEPTPLETVRMYTTHTDIVDSNTAKRRAKKLRSTDAWNEAVGK